MADGGDAKKTPSPWHSVGVAEMPFLKDPAEQGFWRLQICHELHLFGIQNKCYEPMICNVAGGIPLDFED